MANMYNYNTSSAHKLDYNYFDNRETKAVQQRKNHEGEKKSVQLRERRIKAIATIVAVFTMAFILVNRYVQINEAQNKINALQNEYNSIVATNQDLQAKIDKAVDLKKLQSVASEKFGMIRPERYQMFYIDMEQADFAENVAEDKDAGEMEKIAVQGVPGTLISAMKMFK